MKTFIDNLLENRGLQSAIPFWKLKITDDELKKLIEYIRSKLEPIPFITLNKQERKQRYKEFDRELCLMYALWWNRSYSGGGEKWEPALREFSIPDTYKGWIEEAVKLELTYYKRLNIPLFYIQNSARYIDSVLAQGGLPMRLMQREDVSSSYENYLYYLISEYEDIDERDWQKIDIAKDIAEKYLLNRTLRESEAILGFSMEIVKSYFKEDNSFSIGYENIRQIIQRIKERRGKRTERKSFKVNWAFTIIGSKISLSYSLITPEKIVSNDKTDYICYYLENCLVGFYQKRGEDTFVRMPQSSYKGWREWKKPNKGLSFKKRTTDGIYEEELLNSEPPFIEEPVLLQYHNSNMWLPKSDGDGEGCGCLFPCNWTCPETNDAIELDFEGGTMMWKELSRFDLTHRPLCFTNGITHEELKLDGHRSPFFIFFSPTAPGWIESSSKSILMFNGDARRRCSCFQDNERCNRKDFKFSYKTNMNDQYVRYTGENLPEGTVFMKIVAPNNHSRSFSFFKINGFSYERANQHTIQIDYNNGTCVLRKGQNVEETEPGKYQLIENVNLNGFAPIWFRLYPNGRTNDQIDIALKSPLQQSCFYDGEGRILPNQYPLSINELYKYHLNLEESKDIRIAFYETRDERPNNPICLIRKVLRLNTGRYPLAVLEDDVERLFLMYGFDDYRKYVSVRIAGTGCEIKIRRFTYQAREQQEKDGTYRVRVTRNDAPARDLRLFALALNASEDSPVYQQIFEMENEGEGLYSVPKIENNQETEYLVFSDNSKTNMSILPYFLNTNTSLSIEERNQNKHNSIERIHESLQANDEKEWKKVWRFMEIVKQYQLPYSHSFNCFHAIANDPYLLASFLVRICSFNRFGEEEIIYELQRMEKDLAFGFYYLPLACWQQEKHRIEAIYDNIPQSVQEMIGGRDVYVSSNFRYLKALLERRFGNEGIFIERKLRLGEMANPPITFNSLTYYKEKIHNAFADFDAFNENVRPSWFARVEQPCNLPRNYDIPQLMQYMAIVLPQCAAQYAHGADLELWNYNPDTPYKYFIRRMVNYMSVYVPEAHNELFAIALLREPVNQTN